MGIGLAVRLTLALLLLTGTISSTWATGEFIQEMRFFSRSGMNGVDELAYFHGQLGILRPTFDDNRLFAAYRQLMGGTFTDAQARQLLAPCCDAASADDEVETTWSDARKRVLGSPIREGTGVRQRPPELAALDVSCFPNAYRNAAVTLGQRIKEHGATDPSVREWVTGEDAVLANCLQDAALPPDLPNAPDWLRADRAYQIAAAYLYRLDYAKAAELYAAIGRDTASPWRKLARYLNARAAVHEAMVAKTPESIAAASSAIDTLTHDPDLTDYQSDAPKLASMLAFGTRPRERAQELAQSLLAADLLPSLAVDLHDFKDLERSGERYTDAGAWIFDIDQLVSDTNSNNSDPNSGKSKGDAKADVLRRWHDGHSLTWLVAALMFLDPDDPDAAEAIAAAQSVEATSPAYYTLTWNRLRLLIGQGKADAARTELDRIIAAANLPEGVGNLMRYQRLKLARNIGEFTSFAVRRGEFVMYVYDPRTKLNAVPLPLPSIKWDRDTANVIGWRSELAEKNVPAIDADAAYAMWSFMPLPMMAQVVLAQGLPANVKRDLALAVWTRAVLLEDAGTARSMADALAPFFPQFASDWKSYRGAADAEQRKVEAALLLLKLPAARPYPDSGLGYMYKRDVIGLFGPRWWAADDMPFSDHVDDKSNASLCLDCGLPLPLLAPPFISEADKTSAREENDRIAKFPSAPTWLGAIVIPWAKAHLSDPRVPEALHDVVRATQYGEMDSETSKAAYLLLHNKFPRNPWTVRTPKWF